MDINFTVRGQYLQRIGGQKLIADSVDYLYANFEFSEDWADLVKFALFKHEDDELPYEMVLAENICKVPHEVIKNGKVSVSVYGKQADAESAFRLTTNPFIITFEESGFSDEVENSVDPTPDDIQQLLDLVNQQMISAEEAESFSLLSKSYAVGGTGERAGEDTDNAKYYKDQAKDYRDDAVEAAEDAAEAADNVLNEVSTHNTSVSAHEDIRDEIRQVDAIARGKAKAKVFDTVEDMNAWLAVPENVETLNVGDNLYIRALDVPDYWWDGVSVQKLEVEAPDLTDYYTREQVNALLPITITESEYLALLADGLIETDRDYNIIVGE